jgi:uroporphyrinogen-III synthase
VSEALLGRRVLVPRGGQWGERVARLLAAHGGRADVVPVIAFAPPEDVAPLDAALERLRAGTYDWVTVTSATTVDALAARCPLGGQGGDEQAGNGQGGLSDAVGRTPVAAVGPGTARALERHGVVPALLPAGERSARGLAESMPPPGEDARPVLVPHSDLADATLADALRAAGWRVEEVVAYRTVRATAPPPQVRERMAAGGYDAVLLTSGSTVAGVLELVGTPPPATLVCCIGPRTEQAAREAGLTVHVRPTDASAEDLVDALVDHLTSSPDSPPRPLEPR